MSLTRQQPRFPGSTVEDRLALYAEIYGATHFQATAATEGAPVAVKMALSDQEVEEPYVVLRGPLDVGETLTVNVLIRRPADVAPVSILAAPIVLDNTFASGVRIPLPLDPAFNGLVPTGTVIYGQNTLAGPSLSPSNSTFLPLVPST